MSVNRICSGQKTIILTLLLVVCVLVSGCTQQPEQKVYTVGILSGAEQFIDTVDGFKAKMTELGYIEGYNIVYDLERLNDDPAGEERVSQEFVDENVDLIFAFPTEAARSARIATEGTGIPVVFAWTTIEGTGVVESLQKPGGNITGVRLYSDDLMVKRLELFLELAPDVKRVWTIYSPDIVAATAALELMKEFVSTSDVEIVETQIDSVEDVRAEIERRNSLSDIGVDAIFLMPDAYTNAPEGFGMLHDFANEHNLPISALVFWQVEAGAIQTFTPDPAEMGDLAATQTDKVLKGTTAGTIPVVTCDGSLWINYKVATEMGLTVSEGMLALADRIIR